MNYAMFAFHERAEYDSGINLRFNVVWSSSLHYDILHSPSFSLCVLIKRNDIIVLTSVHLGNKIITQTAETENIYTLSGCFALLIHLADTKLCIKTLLPARQLEVNTASCAFTQKLV